MIFESIKIKAKQLKKQSLTVYYVSRDPRLPVYIKLISIFVVAYAFSPIDLIPDFIPVLGLLDDIIIIPLGLALIIRLTPPEIMESARVQAEQAENKPVYYTTAVLFVIIWIITVSIFCRWAYNLSTGC
jgi:uncharacterized membrane protein YkvA (DUF1232 family)